MLLKSKHSFLAVRKDDEFIYIGNEQKLNIISKLLPQYGVSNTDVDGGIYLGGREPF